MEASSIFYNQIKSQQFEDKEFKNLKEKVLQGKVKEAILDNKWALWIRGRLCIPRVDNLIPTKLAEAHDFKYSIHLNANNIYRDLRQHLWWKRMMPDIVDFLVKSQNYLQVKYEHRKPSGSFQ